MTEQQIHEYDIEEQASLGRWVNKFSPETQLHHFVPEYIWEVAFRYGYEWAKEEWARREIAQNAPPSEAESES